MAKTLLIAADVDASFRERAAQDARFDVVDHPVRTEEELRAIVGQCEILVTRSYNRVSRAVIDAAPRLELIAQGTSGTDNIDADTARERGISIVSLPGENANAVAELVIGFMIALTRTVPTSTAELKGGVWNRYDCSSRHELSHFRLGIVGLGQVGMRVARMAGTFNMLVQAFDPYIAEADFMERGATRSESLEQLLESSDVITLHVPLTPETRGMIDRAKIASLRPGAYLINAARGEVMDQQAAVDALVAGRLSGLALDVFEPEPPGRAFPDDPRLILTPHIGGCTYEAKAAIGAKLYEKICAFYEGA
jgi:phosphoglycerate dehydrogenase-like enzyme